MSIAHLTFYDKNLPDISDYYEIFEIDSSPFWCTPEIGRLNITFDKDFDIMFVDREEIISDKAEKEKTSMCENRK